MPSTLCILPDFTLFYEIGIGLHFVTWKVRIREVEWLVQKLTCWKAGNSSLIWSWVSTHYTVLFQKLEHLSWHVHSVSGPVNDVWFTVEQWFSCWNHLESFKKYWYLDPISRVWISRSPEREDFLKLTGVSNVQSKLRTTTLGSLSPSDQIPRWKLSVFRSCLWPVNWRIGIKHAERVENRVYIYIYVKGML